MPVNIRDRRSPIISSQEKEVLCALGSSLSPCPGLARLCIWVTLDGHSRFDNLGTLSVGWHPAESELFSPFALRRHSSREGWTSRFFLRSTESHPASPWATRHCPPVSPLTGHPTIASIQGIKLLKLKCGNKLINTVLRPFLYDA